MPEVHYSAGLGEGVLVVSGSAFVVVRGRLDGAHAERIWAALRYERPLPEVLDAVTRGRLGELLCAGLDDDVFVAVDGTNGLLADSSTTFKRSGLDRQVAWLDRLGDSCR